MFRSVFFSFVFFIFVGCSDYKEKEDNMVDNEISKTGNTFIPVENEKNIITCLSMILIICLI